MYKHRIFKIVDNTNVIIFIPTLFKVYLTSSELVSQIPDYVISETLHPVSRWDSLSDYIFFGTNLILTNHCNLACSYCYADCSPKKDMTITDEIAIAAVDYIADCARKAKHELIYVNMFGGEPTQAWDVMVLTVKYLRQKAEKTGVRSRATITTNGCMEPYQVRWLVENMDHINISFDGYKEIQDTHRSNSFDKAFKTAREIYNIAPNKLRFRSTVSEFSVEHLLEIVQFFSENFPGCNQMYEPLFTIGRGQTSKYGMPSSKEFFKKFLESLPVAEKFGCKLKTSILNLGNKSFEFCGVAARNFMVTPDGRCTTCNRMAEDDNKLSNSFTYGFFNVVTKVFQFDSEAYQHLKRLSTQNLPECQDCFAFSSCRGDCAANKAILDPNDFWQNRTYRCEEIRQFVKDVLLYVLNKKSSLVKI